MATRSGAARKPSADLAFLCRALKAPSLAASIDRLATRARDESWTHEEFLAACLEREVAARQDHGGEGRIRAARFPARKTLEDFDYDHQRSLKRTPCCTSAPSTSSPSAPTSCSSARPAPARPTSPSASASGPAKPATASRSPPPPNGVARLADAHTQGRLQAELTRLGRIPLLVIDEVGYIPVDADAANLFFQLVSSRYERASVIVTSNKPFGRWGEVFGDATVAAAMIDRLVHHAEVISLKGDSYRLKDRDLGRVPTGDTQ
jgi:DNA replication protein DnaC